MKFSLPTMLLLVVAGCASSRPAPPPPTTSVTHVTAAEVNGDAPKVGKAQADSDAEPVDEVDPKAAPRRHDERKPGGGFSGYK
jgi:hypothetical protein